MSPLAVGAAAVVNAIVPVKPPVKASVIVLVAVAPPLVNVRAAGEALRENALTLSETVVVRTSDPLVPVIVTG